MELERIDLKPRSKKPNPLLIPEDEPVEKPRKIDVKDYVWEGKDLSDVLWKIGKTFIPFVLILIVVLLVIDSQIKPLQECTPGYIDYSYNQMFTCTVNDPRQAYTEFAIIILLLWPTWMSIDTLIRYFRYKRLSAEADIEEK